MDTEDHTIEARAAATTANPWNGKTLFVNPVWANKLEPTYKLFKNRTDEANAAKVRVAQGTGTFVWISSKANLPDIDQAISSARAKEKLTGVQQMVGLVLYDIPGRDWSGGKSWGEFPATEAGLTAYKETYIKPFAKKVAAATDLDFAIILEPDAMGNLVSQRKDQEFVKLVAPLYERAIAYSIMSLQFSHISLYIDAANGGWLGWDDTLGPTATELAKIFKIAKDASKGRAIQIRGFSTNVSNFNLFNAKGPESYTVPSKSWDESHYILALVPYLKQVGLPLRFIVDQSRNSIPGKRKSWADWGNLNPASFGIRPGTPVGNQYVDSIVWVKPPGESDGQNITGGFPGAPKAGVWFPQYVEMLFNNTKF
ncbi:exoglucanase 3 [Ilyonectria robusta]|uniref:exoglucanase 3 n=1 Tax=Ilyonectria robusta TaxID=1079257 RepID=UPI001E8D82D3|nr:exoglucanase 3 [Ilyonectria robusta]KAH8737569.1 exoglucanase 3 [Ilyonectria robusta]